MMKFHGLGFGVGCTITGVVLSSLYSQSFAQAQIAPDNTLGTESSTVAPTEMNGLPTDRINGGALRGANLFHSFAEFNVAAGQRVYFANPAGVSQILTRVTGANPSQILGHLGVDGAASLFLINPNGILFGANASLDVRGSFVASTADRLTFSNGEEFSAVSPQAAPLLTINLQPGLQFGTQRSAAITNRGSLAVGQNLTLAANSLDLQGQLQAGGDLTLHAINIVQIRDTVTQPFIAQANGQLEVQGDRGVDIFALNHRSSGFYSGGDMVLRSATPVSGDAHYWSGGNFRIEQIDRTLGDLHSPHDPIIRASGDVSFNGYFGPSLHILAGGQVSISGTVTINGTDILADTINPTSTPALAFVTLSDGSAITIDGNSFPTLDIRAGTTAFGTPGLTETGGPFGFITPFPSFTAPRTSANITIGNIRITQPNGQVYLSNQYAPDLSLSGGTITVNGTIDTRSTANSGSVIIDARSNLILNGSINTSSATGAGGNVALLARDTLLLLNSINTQAATNSGAVVTYAQNNLVLAPINTSSATGAGGNVTLLARDNLLIDRNITTDTKSANPAGNLTLVAPQVIVQNNANLSTNTLGAGQGGDITIWADRLTLQDNAQLSAITGDDPRINPLATPSTGRGGNITIVANETANLTRQSFIFAQTNPLSSGAAGDITIRTNQLNLDGGSLISSATLGAGQGGNIQLQVQDALTLTGSDTANTQTGIFLNAFSSGNAGNLQISDAKQIDLRGGALISASASAQGRAGNLIVNTPDAIVQLTGVSNRSSGQTASSFLAETRGSGRGGDVQITARRLHIAEGAQVTAQTIGVGDAGTLAVNASEQVNVSGSSGTFLSRLFFDSSGSGNAGTLSISTPQLQIQNGGRVSARTRSSGIGGVIQVVAPQAVEINGTAGTSASGLYFDSLGSGNAQGIQVTTGQLTVQNSGQITVSGSGTGNAGNIDIVAESVDLLDRARITATTTSGEGGNITLRVADTLILRRDSDIRTQAFGTGNGGNIQLTAGTAILAVLSEDSDVIATAITGRGGNINANAPAILGFRQFDRVETPESDFRATSELGIDGTVNLDDRNPQPLPTLPDQLNPPLLAQVCFADAKAMGDSSSYFYITGRGGIIPSPAGTLANKTLWQDDRISTEATTTTEPAASETLTEATRWMRAADGTIVLTSEPVTNYSASLSWTLPGCGGSALEQL